MLKVLLGPGGFRKGLDLYFTRHDGEAATVDQFVECFAEANNTDLTQFMRWYAQAGTPEVIATGSYNAAAQSYRLDVRQAVPLTPGQPHKEAMVIPLALGLVGRDGRDMSLSLEGGRPVVRGVVTSRKLRKASNSPACQSSLCSRSIGDFPRRSSSRRMCRRMT